MLTIAFIITPVSKIITLTSLITIITSFLLYKGTNLLLPTMSFQFKTF